MNISRDSSLLSSDQLDVLRWLQTAAKPSLRRTFARRFGRWIAGNFPTWSARPAMERLKDCPQKILLDNSVLAHRCFSFTGPSGRTGQLEQEHSCTEEQIVHVFQNSRFWEDRQYFYGIRNLAVSGRLQLFDSYELAMERLTQPIGRFTDARSLYTEDVFDGVEFGMLNQYSESLTISPESAMEAQREMSRRGGGVVLRGDEPIPEWLVPDVFDTHKSTNERIAGYEDPLYRSLLDVLGGKRMNKDAWHIVTAERHGLDCFMTMDYKLVDRLGQLSNKEPVSSLAVKVLTPSAWGRQQHVRPIPRPDLVGELAGRRRPDPYYRLPENFLTRDETLQQVWQQFVGDPNDREK